MDASINSNTSVTDYLGMPTLRFYETWQAICAVYEQRAQHREEAERKAGKGRKPKKKKHGR